MTVPVEEEKPEKRKDRTNDEQGPSKRRLIQTAGNEQLPDPEVEPRFIILSPNEKNLDQYVFTTFRLTASLRQLCSGGTVVPFSLAIDTSRNRKDSNSLALVSDESKGAVERHRIQTTYLNLGQRLHSLEVSHLRNTRFH